MPFALPESIHTDRLIVRGLERSDLPALLAVNGDEAVTRFLPYASWVSLADAEAWHDRMLALEADGSALQWVVVDKALGRAVGTCLLFRHEPVGARVELGYALGRAHWGAGWMREALTALLGCAFGALALRRIEADVDPRNSASLQLLRRLGFVEEGLMRQRWIAKGEARDSVMFGLLRDEWPAQKSPDPSESE